MHGKMVWWMGLMGMWEWLRRSSFLVLKQCSFEWACCGVVNEKGEIWKNLKMRWVELHSSRRSKKMLYRSWTFEIFGVNIIIRKKNKKIVCLFLSVIWLILNIFTRFLDRPFPFHLAHCRQPKIMKKDQELAKWHHIIV